MSKEFSLATIKEHNKPDDLWLVIDNKVYDVTKFLNEHPGGEESLMSVAGVDGTKDFNEVGHSAEARELLKKFYIGDLAASDIKRKSPVGCREIGVAVGAILLGMALVYVIKRGMAKN
ncbi:cytochrome b5 isoform X1 [Drosophila innubila]|uniref:cytochrome b5 isoform X1 n=1 Tax=Drosophila innubila TaxID=198719 RepID=UPI00148D4AE3|nr:cytochrome b5 isoform X1 [Drosophila innubila]